MKETVVICVDYGSAHAQRVARDAWAILSRKALNSGFAGITARWKSLTDREVPAGGEVPSICIFVVGQDRPEMVEYVSASAEPGSPRLYGLVVATPERPSPLSGSLLYQGVRRLTGGGARAGEILPALIPVAPKTECEAYAARLFERLQEVRTRR